MSNHIGFDFGTTNSLITYIDNNEEAFHLVDIDKNDPIPSSICYDGLIPTCGFSARERILGHEDDSLSAEDENAHFIRSPKTILDSDNNIINGIEYDSIDIVKSVVEHIKNLAISSYDTGQADFNTAVVSIPVTMKGIERQRLRYSFLGAGIDIKYFVHEPLAALYGYLRTTGHFDNNLREYEGQKALVFDWGGGTLDLTLCEISENRITQIANKGNNHLGGDYFDELIRDELIDIHCNRHNLKQPGRSTQASRSRLLAQCEEARKKLSVKEEELIYVADYFVDGEERDIEEVLTRAQLETIVRSKIIDGISEIDQILDKAGLDQRDIKICLATGGMVNMPGIKFQLQEIFSMNRLELSNRGQKIISEGCAWIAHDDVNISLAKDIEVLEARHSHLPFLKAGQKLPSSGLNITGSVNLYCTDPRDGKAKIKIETPQNLAGNNRNDPREHLGQLTIKVDPEADLFFQRIDLNYKIDYNYILHLVAVTAGRDDDSEESIQIFDFEFSLDYSNIIKKSITPKNSIDRSRSSSVQRGRFSVISRSNIISGKISVKPEHRLSAVPGDYLHQIRPSCFDTRHDNATELQKKEYLYYQTCSVCGQYTCRSSCAS